MTEHAHTNRLSKETSPYLRQHAHNPVDWFPWGPKALRLAQLQDKPILLSVGYAACHWCHVMAHESFEDEATAELMNRFFVCVKVDREERPDIDELYMRAVQTITGSGGGWPMTVFLTPEGQPFYGGTYFPPQPRNGLPGFKQTLAHVHLLWKQNRPEVERVIGQVAGYLEESGRMPRPSDALKGGWLDVLADAADKSYDEDNGGFGGAPKFPPHATLVGLLAHWRFTGQARSLAMVTGTLDAMTRGAMYDLVGGGFCRYSVDAEWRVPHFEKMLYDNAQLVPVLADAWKATRNGSYARIARETVDWLLAEMTLPEGGFCASLDADAGGVEGAYYAWTPAQLEAVLGPEAATVGELLQVKADEPEGSVLRLETPLEQNPERNLLARALLMMQGARSRRVAPARDDKVITAWNAMTIRALAYAGVAMNEPTWIDAARRAADFLLTTLVHDGRLLRTWRDGRAHTLAYADDYALLTDALTELYQATFEVRWLREALRLADETVRLFWNEDQGTLFYTGHDAETLVARSANPLGGAVPSANGAAAHAFTRLAALCGREDLGERADGILRSFQRLLDRAPRALGSEAVTAAWRAGRGRELALVGPKPGALLAQARRHVEPTMVMAFGSPEAAALVPWLTDKSPLDEQPTAYLCEGQSCQAPTTDPDALAALLAVAPAPSLPTDLHRDAAPELPDDPALWLNTPQPVRLDALRGRVVILWFWAASSVASLRTLAQLQALTRDLSDQPVQLIGVHAGFCEADDDAAWVQASLARLGVTHPTLRDPVKQVWRQYAAAAWPTVLVLDAHGQVAWAEAGSIDPKKLRIAVDRVLEEARAEGILAAHTHTPRPAPVPTAGALSAPTKVRCWPGAAAQEAGADPFGEDARLYIADTGHHQVLEARIARSEDGWPAHVEVIRRFGTGDAALQDGPVPSFHSPRGLDRADNTLWIADTGNDALRALDLRTGEVRTARAGLLAPWDVSVAEAGTAAEQALIFVAVPGARQLWVHLPQTGQTGPMAGSGKDEHIDGAPHEAALASPRGVELFGQYLFFVDSSVHSVRVMDMADQKLRTLIGKTRADYGDVDGVGDDARMRLPQGITAGHGVVYIADTLNHKIKTIGMSDRAVRTLTASAALSQPEGLTLVGDFLIVTDPTSETLFVVHRETGELRALPVG